MTMKKYLSLAVILQCLAATAGTWAGAAERKSEKGFELSIESEKHFIEFAEKNDCYGKAPYRPNCSIVNPVEAIYRWRDDLGCKWHDENVVECCGASKPHSDDTDQKTYLACCIAQAGEGVLECRVTVVDFTPAN